MLNQFSRTQLLYGRDAMNRFANCRVAVFINDKIYGGFSNRTHPVSIFKWVSVADPEKVTEVNGSNIETPDVVGKYKVDAAAERVKAIFPECEVRSYKTFYLPETQEQFDFRDYDYVVDAVDTITAKMEIVMRCREAGTPVISSMGTGNKLDPSALRAADLFDTKVGPLARVMRRELKKRGVTELKVVYSEEEPRRPRNAAPEGDRRKDVPGSMVFVPAAAGLLIASVVVRDLTGLS